MTGIAASTEIRLSHHVNAPRARVFQAFTDPDLIARWFGPEGFRVLRETIDMDVRAGGHQHLVMVSDQDPQVRSAINATYTEVIDNELLAGTEEAAEIPGLQEAAAITLRVFDDRRRRRNPTGDLPGPAEREDGRDGPGRLAEFIPKLDRVLAST